MCRNELRDASNKLLKTFFELERTISVVRVVLGGAGRLAIVRRKRRGLSGSANENPNAGRGKSPLRTGQLIEQMEIFSSRRTTKLSRTTTSSIGFRSTFENRRSQLCPAWLLRKDRFTWKCSDLNMKDAALAAICHRVLSLVSHLEGIKTVKLRIKGNCVRLRIDQKDLNELITSGLVEDAVRFGSGPCAAFTYSVLVGVAPQDRPQASYIDGRLQITIDRHNAEAWGNSDRVGFDHQQVVDHGTLRVILEKDFACIDRPQGEESDDAWAFSNPSNVC